MASKPNSTKTKSATKPELDSVYILKVLLYLILGSVWLVLAGHRIVPIGLVLGVVLVQHEKLQIDRKVEYAALLIASLIGLSGSGINLVF